MIQAALALITLPYQARVAGRQTMTMKRLSQYTKAAANPSLRLIHGKALVMILFALVWLTGGCTQTARPPETFPTPVIQALPLRVGLYQDRPFRDYVHQGASEIGGTWIIDLRPIHKTFFKTLLGALFSELIEVESGSETYPPVSQLEAIIEPQVQAFTLQNLSAAASSAYRVSVVYLLKIYSPQGELLGSWPVQGQGQGDAGWLQAGQAVTEAVTNALRDIGVQIATQLAETPEIKELLAANRAQETGVAVPSFEER
jgi:hypothetical protein